MRIRTVKPDFFFDEELTQLSHATRLLFIGMWGLADRDGRMEDRPAYIRASVFPYEADFDIESSLTSLSPKFIERYEVEGRRFIWIRKFREHQRITGKEFETVSRFPPAPGETTGKQPGNTPDDREAQEGKGREGKRKGKDIATATVIPEDLQTHQDAILAWLEYKRERGQVYKGKVGLRALWVRLRAIAPEKRNEAINYSMSVGWAGIFEPKGEAAGTPKPGDPGYEVTDVDRVIAAYRNAKKIPKDDDEWRTIMWERQRKDAQALLDYFAGDWRAAVDCISATAEKCEGMEWGWRAVMGRAPEIKNREVSR